MEQNFPCSKCGTRHSKQELVAKRVHFAALGKGHNSFMSKTTDWLCEDCLKADPAFTQAPYHGAPRLRTNPSVSV